MYTIVGTITAPRKTVTSGVITLSTGSQITGSGNLTFGIGSISIGSALIAPEYTLITGRLAVTGALIFSKSVEYSGTITVQNAASLSFAGAATATAPSATVITQTGQLVHFGSLCRIQGTVIASGGMVAARLALNGPTMIGSLNVTGTADNQLNIELANIVIPSPEYTLSFGPNSQLTAGTINPAFGVVRFAVCRTAFR